MLSVIKKDYMSVAKQIEQSETANFTINLQPYQYNLYKLYLTIGIDKAIQEQNKLAKHKADGDYLIYEWLLFLKGYADKTLAERVTKIPDTTKKELAKIIEEGLADGKGYKEIARDIRSEATGDFNQSRSLLIARTEGNNAVNAGAFIAARSSGLVMIKRWLHAGHSKRENRPEHVRLDRMSKENPLGLNDYFTVNGKQMLFPGDPAGGAEENCNCRCIGTYRPKRDANDELIAVNRNSYQVTSVQRATRTALIENMLREFADIIAGVVVQSVVE